MPRSCAGPGQPPRVRNRTTATSPSKLPKDPDRSGSWGCDPRAGTGQNSPPLPYPPPSSRATVSWGLSLPRPAPRGCWEWAYQEAGGNAKPGLRLGEAVVSPRQRAVIREAGEAGRHSQSTESAAGHVWFRYSMNFPMGSRQIQGRTPHPNAESDTTIWLKCSLRGLLGPDPGDPTGRTSVQGLPPLGRGWRDSPKL